MKLKPSLQQSYHVQDILITYGAWFSNYLKFIESEPSQLGGNIWVNTIISKFAILNNKSCNSAVSKEGYTVYDLGA